MTFGNVLPPDAYERLLFALDPLTLYANERLHVSDYLLNGYAENATIDEVEQHYVLEELWANPDVFDDYLRDNPDHLTLDERAVLSAWRNPLSSIFVVFEHRGRTLFMGDGYLFDVCGLDREVSEDLRPLPCPVHATLLPFEGRIVYDGYVDPMGVEIMPELARGLEARLAEAVERWEVVSTAERLREVVPLIEEERARREAESMFASLELDMNPDLQFEGHHRGILAGLSDEERKQRVAEREERALTGPEHGFAHRVLLENCEKGSPVSTLEEALMLDTKARMEVLARAFDVKGTGSKRKATLAAELAVTIEQQPEVLQYMIEALSSPQLERLRELRDAGGRISVPDSGSISLGDYPEPISLFNYLFHEDGEFVFVMPRESLEIAAGLDWDYAIEQARKREEVVNLCNVLVTMRGIVPLGEAYEDYRRAFPDKLQLHEFCELTRAACMAQMGVYDIVEAEDIYLVHYVLGNDYREELFYGKADRVFVEPLLEGLDSLLDEQGDTMPKPLEEGVLNQGALLEWEYSQPAVRAMIAFLDAHVPDGQDDYTFADNLVFQLLDIMHMGMGPQAAQEYFNVFADFGFLPEERFINKLLDLLTNMANSLPCWPDNGWSPNEMLERELGRKLFFNEDGSIMKLGDNDPCPCGSGRQYGECHGMQTRGRSMR